VRAKLEVRSFTRSWDNRGYPKKLGSLWIRPSSLFSNIFHGLLLEWALLLFWPNLKSVALPVREIIAIGILGREPSILEKRRPQGVGDGAIGKSVGKFL